MTGSGMPMRFADTDGSLIDVYQATTQMTDESGQSYPFTPNTLLDRALGPLGYYGAFTANMHTDSATTFESDQVLASAQARGVPVVTARQMLTWLDGRNASSFSGISWSGNTLTFTVNVGAGANGLTAMLPTAGPGGTHADRPDPGRHRGAVHDDDDQGPGVRDVPGRRRRPHGDVCRRRGGARRGSVRERGGQSDTVDSAPGWNTDEAANSQRW